MCAWKLTYNRIYSISEKIDEHMKKLKNENMILEQMY